ncbi:hypothetical protein MASR1M48_17190 [Lactococcus petauri]
MAKKKKIRHKNWYWGKFIYDGQVLDNTRFTINSDEFEEYDEEKHGWHHSEEYKSGYRTTPYKEE